MSYLDDPRVFFAAERTMLAWQRTAIALIGLGFVIERFGLFVRLVALSAGTPAHPESGGVSLVFGVALLLVGAAVAGLSALQFGRFIRRLSPPEVPRGYFVWFGPVVNTLLAALAAALAAWFVLTR